MITYFPEIYPDELVYSWLCRYYVHSGYFSSKAAMRELYCKRSDNPSKEFIGNLNSEIRMKISEIYPLDRLILDHTMFPQYARFLPLEQKLNALRRLEQDSCDIHRLFAVLPRIEGDQFLRFCPLCVEDDRQKYGETYWHRKHQLRNINICTRHECRLIESSVPAKSEQCFTFEPAEYSVSFDKVTFEKNRSLIEYSAYLESVFYAPMDFKSDIPISAVLYNGMSRTKYLKSSGRTRYTKLIADDMNEFYTKLGVFGIPSMYQIQRALLGMRFDFSVICQIAFFLGMKPHELTAPNLTPEQIKQEQDSHYMKNAEPVDWEMLDKETAPILEKFVRGVYDGTANENGRPERVSEKLAYRKMNLLGGQLENMPRCKAIVERYAETYPESWARKIIWAYKNLTEVGKPFYWSDIRRISGVKKKNFPVIIPYLYKHADTDSAVKIIALVENEQNNIGGIVL